jgi:hypothetical protein
MSQHIMQILAARIRRELRAARLASTQPATAR